jgi:hypothetical protein
MIQRRLRLCSRLGYWFEAGVEFENELVSGDFFLPSLESKLKFGLGNR